MVRETSGTHCSPETSHFEFTQSEVHCEPHRARAHLSCHNVPLRVTGRDGTHGSPLHPVNHMILC